jgi:uncharacterized protein YkwD
MRNRLLGGEVGGTFMFPPRVFWEFSVVQLSLARLPRLRVLGAVVLGLVLSALGLSIRAGAAVATSARHHVVTAVRLDQSILDDLNAIRASHGLRELRLNESLSAAASEHSLDMLESGYFDHSSPTLSLSQRVIRYYPRGRHRMWRIGENLLYASPWVRAGTAINMWLQSPEHAANMLEPGWRDVGISAMHTTHAGGLYGGHEVTVITVDFGVRR